MINGSDDRRPPEWSWAEWQRRLRFGIGAKPVIRHQGKSREWAERVIANLEAAMLHDDLSERAREIVERLIGHTVIDAVAGLVWAKLQTYFRGPGVLVSPSCHRAAKHVTISSLDPDVDRAFADWVLDMIGPELEEVFQTKKRRK